MRLEIASFEPPDYAHAESWRTKPGMVAFQNEIMKYLSIPVSNIEQADEWRERRHSTRRM